MASDANVTTSPPAAVAGNPPDPPEHHSFSAFWALLVRFQKEKLTFWIGVRNTLGVALPLLVGLVTGNMVPGLNVAAGALNVAFSDSDEPYRRRGHRMLAASVLVALAVGFGSWSGNHPLLATAVSAGWAFAVGMLVALSQAAADVGGISLVTLVVYAAAPQTPEHAVAIGGLAFLGGLLQTGLALTQWPLRRYRPERRALGQVFLELGRMAAAPASATQAPPATAEISRAREVLAALDRDRTVDGERYRILLSQTERMRLSILLLGRLRIRLERECPQTQAHPLLDQYFEHASPLLSSLGALLSGNAQSRVDVGALGQLDRLAREMRDVNASCKESGAAVMVNDARYQLDALSGQLRASVELATVATPAGLDAFERRENRRPWRLQLEGALDILRANLTSRSAAYRHAVRLSVAVALGEALARGAGLNRSYWVPMTIAIVLKSDFSATFTRGVLRLAGTFAGLGLATLLFHFLRTNDATEILLISVMMFLVRWAGGANYGIFVTAVTALVVLLIALPGVEPQSVIGARAVNTVIGGFIALGIYAAWPTWERTLWPESLATLLDSYREYFRAIRMSYEQPGGADNPDLDQKRFEARLARSNFEASMERSAAEPRTPAQDRRALGGMLATSHRLVHGFMALEAGLAASPPAPARPAFRKFANDVELTLYYLTAALRGSPLERDNLPDLREDHHHLVSSGAVLTERYAIVNIETDRITNSLNTLAVELLDWLHSNGRARTV